MTNVKEFRVNTSTVVAASVLLVALIAAGVLLALAGWQPSAILGFLALLIGLGTPLLTLLDRVVNMHRLNVEQTTTLDTVNRRVNGELDARMAAAATSAAEEAIRRVMNVDTAPATEGQE